MRTISNDSALAVAWPCLAAQDVKCLQHIVARIRLRTQTHFLRLKQALAQLAKQQFVGRTLLAANGQKTQGEYERMLCTAYG